MVERIEQLVRAAVPQGASFTVSVPSDDSLGHYTTNVALRLAGTKEEAFPLACEFVKRIAIADRGHICDRIEAAKPGFINFWLSRATLYSELGKMIHAGSSYGRNESGIGKRACVEYVSANPTGPIHIGNARGGPLGETISRVLEANGWKVVREYLHNDAGTQVERLGATLFYWYEKLRGVDVSFPDDGYRGEYLREVAEAASRKLGNDLKPADFGRITEFGLDYLFRENLAVLERMGIRFDRIIKESELISSGATERAVAELTEFGVTRKQDGALWFAPGDEFLGDREAVIVRSTGQPTYFASDVAYHRKKFTDGYDLVIDVFGSNHHGHVPKLRALTKLYGFDPARFAVILYQFVRVKRGKEVVRMSKRAGTYVTAREVIDEVGVDSVVFFLLMHAAGSHMDFDLALATEQSAENPVYYVQYAHVRAKSILANSLSGTPTALRIDQLTGNAELALIRRLAQFPDLIAETAKTFEVHRIPSYALSLARSFHSFYERERVLVPDADLAAARLALVSATANVLVETLRLLGVGIPDKM